MRVKILCSYDGSRYYGSAPQPNQKTVIGHIQDTMQKTVGIKTSIMGSGRTDRGVHSSGQVLHADIPSHWDNRLDRLVYLLNKHLLPSTYIKSIFKVDDDFHSRFDAKRRVYRYVVSTSTPSVFMAPYVTYVDSIDYNKIKDAIKLYEGIHNFEYFKKNSQEENGFIREVYKSRFYKYKDFYIFYFEANAYLRSQIRMMVGFLLQISDGKLSSTQLQEQLDRVHQHSALLAPANGLYLAKIKY